jgi:hypothetical protein
MSDLASRFYSGRYTEIISECIDSASSPVVAGEDVVFVVGSLAFLSRASEAETLLAMHEPNMSDESLVEARYYLATSWRRMRTRESGKKSRNALIGMARTIRSSHSSDPRQLFFLYCGLAFYRYVDGRYSRALQWAQKAYDCAFKSGFAFGRLVAYDLMGHSQLMTGQVTAGLKNLGLSAKIAEGMGRGAVHQAVDVAQRLYRSTYGLLSAEQSCIELENAIKACEFENSYTLANLYLEYARLQILSGHGHLAEDSLREAGEWVYRLDVPFLDAQLNFRYAYLAYLKMNYTKAIDLIAVAERRAVESQSESLRLVILGLKHRVLHASGKYEDQDEAVHELRRLENRTEQLTSRRIHARLGWGGTPARSHGQDRLGDLMDDIHHHVKDIRVKVLASGYLGLIPQMVGCPLFSETLIFGFDGSSVTVINQGRVRHDSDGWPDLVKRLVMLLNERRKASKDEITEYVWRQKYNPLRHDPLIYALIARFKKTLDVDKDWIFVDDGNYRIRDAVRVIDASVKAEPVNPPIVMVESAGDLSLRQEKILDYCRRTGGLTNREVCKEFRISEVTAGRDLADLVEKGYLRRTGKGRATTYIAGANL